MIVSCSVLMMMIANYRRTATLNGVANHISVHSGLGHEFITFQLPKRSRLLKNLPECYKPVAITRRLSAVRDLLLPRFRRQLAHSVPNSRLELLQIIAYRGNFFAYD